MKKITSLIVLFILLVFINACTGYKPIFGSSNLQFEITDYLIEGDKKLGNQIYSKLYNLSKSNKNQEGIKSEVKYQSCNKKLFNKQKIIR